MDSGQLKKHVFQQLLTHPLTVAPAVAGLSALIVAWGADAGAGWLAFAGVAGVLASIGSFTTQWLLRAEDLTRRAFESLEAETVAEQERELDKLYRRLKKDDDPRDEKLFKQLREVYRRFHEDSGWVGRLSQQSAVEIAGPVEKLFEGCIITLQRSLELVEASRKMTTKEGRRTALEARERLLEEVAESIRQMAHTVDGVLALGLQQHDGRDLARIRQELDESLNVARRVEERMQSMESELGREAMRE